MALPCYCCCSSNHNCCHCYPSYCCCSSNCRCSSYCCCSSYCRCSSTWSWIWRCLRCWLCCRSSYCCCPRSWSWIWCRLWCCSLVDLITASISIENTKANENQNHEMKFLTFLLRIKFFYLLILLQNHESIYFVESSE